MFANDEERKVNKLPRIFDIPISEIDDFPDHPFKVKIDEDMDQLVQSIKERGSSPLSHFARRKTDAMRSYPAIVGKRLVNSQDWTL